MASNTFVDSILTNDLVYDNILRSVDPSALVRLARTCRTAHAAVQSHIGRSFNINTHFSRYFSDPLAFRSLQATTGTLVSGSNALQFLDRSFWPEADLDLYCLFEARIDVGGWLQQQGYTFEPSHRQKASFLDAANHLRVPDFYSSDFEFPEDEELYKRMKNISAVYTFGKVVNTPDDRTTKLKVQVVVACHSPMEAILAFHSTLVMNVISFSHAYSLYPRATFLHRVSLELCDNFDYVADGVEAKYRSRGWRFTDAVPIPDDPVRASRTAEKLSAIDRQQYLRGLREKKSLAFAFPDGIRWIGDSHSWVLPLPTEGIRELPDIWGSRSSKPLAHDPSIATTWVLRDVEKDDNVDSDDEERDDAEEAEVEVQKRITPRLLRAQGGFRFSYVIIDAALSNEWKKVRQRHLELTTAGVLLAYDYCDQQFLDFCKDKLQEQEKWRIWYRRFS